MERRRPVRDPDPLRSHRTDRMQRRRGRGAVSGDQPLPARGHRVGAPRRAPHQRHDALPRRPRCEHDRDHRQQGQVNGRVAHCPSVQRAGARRGRRRKSWHAPARSSRHKLPCRRRDLQLPGRTGELRPARGGLDVVVPGPPAMARQRRTLLRRQVPPVRISGELPARSGQRSRPNHRCFAVQSGTRQRHHVCHKRLRSPH